MKTMPIGNHSVPSNKSPSRKKEPLHWKSNVCGSLKYLVLSSSMAIEKRRKIGWKKEEKSFGLTN
jgi:hypothetical protein